MAKKKSAPKKSSNKTRTKSEILTTLAAETGLTKKDVASVVDGLTGMMKKDLSKAGAFVLSGVLKVTVVKKPATKARKGINPFTKEEMMFKARPARNVVKIRALKALKESV